MTPEMVKAATDIGDTFLEDKNVSVGEWGVREQWVYEIGGKKMYLYYENGKLTSFQY